MEVVESRMLEAGGRSAELVGAGDRVEVEVEVGSRMLEVGGRSAEPVEVGGR